MRTKKAKKKEPENATFRLQMAEGVGFEPT